MTSTAPPPAASETSAGANLPALGRLLEPLSADDPAGEALRYDPVYDRIKELRREDDPTLPQGVWQRELKRADWPGVAAECIAALSERSKDLQIAVWLTDAWLHADGLPGLARGLEVVAALVERFGADLHPRPDEEEEAPPFAVPERLAPVAWLDAALPEGLARLALSRPGAEDVPNRTWADWKYALYVENLAKNQPDAASSEGGVTRADFLAGVGLTPAAFYAGLAADTVTALAALGALEAALAAQAGDEAPGFTATRDTLESIGRFARRIAAERGEPAAAASVAPDSAPAPEPSGAEGDEPSAAPGAAPEPRFAGPCRITSRDEAYRALSQAADFLLRVEPHSPVPYVVRRAVSWGGLSLAELYDELFAIADPKTVFRLLGIRGGDEA